MERKRDLILSIPEVHKRCFESIGVCCTCHNDFVFNHFIKIGGKQMSIKKEPAIADPSQYNYITKVANRLRNAKTSELDMLSHPVISDVNRKSGEFEERRVGKERR